uniref:RING-type domain-containing protein n=1 Tax=Ascaris lumbricoides TaxID=6252 RepID=A0A9J2PI85_ASCLU
MSSDGEIVKYWCRICLLYKPVEEMFQILPCLHIFCNDCISKYKSTCKGSFSSSAENSNQKDNATDKKTQPLCPDIDCFSLLKQTNERKLDLCRCDNEMCLRRLSFIILERLSCGHELCTTCLEEARKSQQPVCPVEKCNEPLSDVADDVDACDGPCKQAFTDDNYVTTKCCGAHLCFQCAEKIFGHVVTKDEELRCPNACVLKKARQPPPDTTDRPATCKGKENCTGTVLNGFPSRGECDHEMCLQCLEEMIDDSQKNGVMPRCPNLTCNTFYCVDSVIALKALLPEKSSYFNDLALENQGYDAIKDESITTIEIDPKFKSAGRLLTIKVQISDDDSIFAVSFDQKGNLADFIREVRRELKIFPLDKVYGYYIRRPSADEDEKKPDEEIVVNASTAKRCINDLKLTPDCTLIVDTSGIVQPKTTSLASL